MVFCKYVIILNILIIFLFFDCLEGIKEIFCFFFNNFWFLVDFLIGFEFIWSFDYLLEKKEWMDFVGFLRNFLIFFGSGCWIFFWLINVWYFEFLLLMELKWFLDWLEDFFNWLEFVIWMKLVGRYRSKIINLLILEELKDFFNVLFLGLMKFIGIGRNFVK